jgi:hypothetical protein
LGETVAVGPSLKSSAVLAGVTNGAFAVFTLLPVVEPINDCITDSRFSILSSRRAMRLSETLVIGALWPL